MEQVRRVVDEPPSPMDVQAKEARRITREEIRAREEWERYNLLSIFWRSKVYIGSNVIEKVSGMTGEVLTVEPWGVQVWIPHTGYTKQNWTWPMLAMRFPRNIKRYPRPFRFPREEPTPCCHCKMGKMEVEGEHEIRCTRCHFLIGDESFPRRIKRAETFIKKKFTQPDGGRKIRPRMDRPKKRTTSHPGAKRKNPSRVGVRTRGRKEKRRHAKSKVPRNQKVPPISGANAIPPIEGTITIPPGTNAVPQTSEVVQEERKDQIIAP